MSALNPIVSVNEILLGTKSRLDFSAIERMTRHETVVRLIDRMANMIQANAVWIALVAVALSVFVLVMAHNASLPLVYRSTGTEQVVKVRIGGRTITDPQQIRSLLKRGAYDQIYVP